MSARRGLQMVLSLLGTFAVISATSTVLFGASSISGVTEVTPEVDSEMRFFAVWYAVAGVIILRSVPKVERSGSILKATMAAYFVAGFSRFISLIVVGIPHPAARTFMVIELLLPVIVLPWHAAVVRAADAPPPVAR